MTKPTLSDFVSNPGAAVRKGLVRGMDNEVNRTFYT